MDIREFAFWYKEAQRKLIQDQMKQIQAVRAGMAEESSYRRIMGEFGAQLNNLESGKNKVIRQNWQDLKRMRRR